MCKDNTGSMETQPTEMQPMEPTPTVQHLMIGQPLSSQIMELRKLWKETFGDSDAFLDTFEKTAFSLDRCRCVTIDGCVIAALYWFDCSFLGQPIAYIYAVATAKAFRGQGICHALMKNTHEHLKEAGYEGAILSPASDELFSFYEKMGYETCSYVEELSFDEDTLVSYSDKCRTTTEDFSLRAISKEEFVKLRREFLPKDAVLQEKENLDFLETQASFYAGNEFLLTARKEGDSLQGIEFLGDASVLPAILQKMNCTCGTFRTIGMTRPFGMYYSFTGSSRKPAYLGFIFD